MPTTVSTTAVRVTVFALPTIALLSTCSCQHPTVRSVVKTAVTTGDSNPVHLIYQFDFTNHITISHINQVSEKPATDNPNNCNCVLKDDAEKPATKPPSTPHDCCPSCQCHIRKNSPEKTTTKLPYSQSGHYRRSVDEKQFPVDSYKLYESPRTWSEAKKTCEQEGTHLVIINSKAEEELVRKVMGRHRRLFIGLRYLEQGDYFETALGDRLNLTLYANWNKETDSSSSSELCGSMWFTGEIVIADCNDRHAFICELSA